MRACGFQQRPSKKGQTPLSPGGDVEGGGGGEARLDPRSNPHMKGGHWGNYNPSRGEGRKRW